MTINKITNAPTPNEQINKINDLVNGTNTNSNNITTINNTLPSKENTSNKVSSITNTTSTTLYPSNKAVVDYVNENSGGSSRNIGEIVSSTIPLTDAGLHLLDGALISGSGSNSDFVNYIANLYNATGSIQLYAWRNTNQTPSVLYTDTATPTANSTLYTVNNGYATPFNKVSFVGIPSDSGASVGKYCYISDDNKIARLDSYSSGYEGTSFGRSSTYDTEAHGGIFCSESDWQTSVTNYGVCGKFVYDSTNNTVRLPKITGIIEGTDTASNLGDLLQAGLPNITGSISTQQNGINKDGTQSGSALYGTQGTGYTHSATTTSNGCTSINLDASLSNSIYGNSSTVQPQAIKVLYYIVVATSTKTEIEVDIDEIATDLNGKADVDLSNCTKPHIIETYKNGSSWYRIYSDGWCEQGGEIYAATATDSYTVSLLINMTKKTYFVKMQRIGSVTGTSNTTSRDVARWSGNVVSRDLSSFVIQVGNATPFNWYVCGY